MADEEGRPRTHGVPCRYRGSAAVEQTADTIVVDEPVPPSLVSQSSLQSAASLRESAHFVFTHRPEGSWSCTVWKARFPSTFKFIVPLNERSSHLKSMSLESMTNAMKSSSSTGSLPKDDAETQEPQQCGHTRVFRLLDLGDAIALAQCS